MTLKNIVKTGLATSALVAAGLAVGSNDVSAQNIGDSTKVTKTIGLEFLIYDENTNLPIEGAGADVAGKFSGDITYRSFFATYYNFDDPIMTDENGKFKGTADVPVFDQVTDVKQDNSKLIPNKFGLAAYPNPYNPSTNITFDVLEPGNVNVGIYNVLGQEIVKWSGKLTKGNYSVKAGGGTAGVELAVVKTENGSRVFKMVNLGGSSTPFIEVPSSSGNDLSSYVNGESGSNKTLGKFADDPLWVVDTLSVEWTAPGYLGNVFYAIPVNGATSGKIDSLVTRYQKGVGFVFNKIIPGENGVDTVRQYLNKGTPNNPLPYNKFWGQVLLYGKGDGSAADSIKFELPLGHD